MRQRVIVALCFVAHGMLGACGDDDGDGADGGAQGSGSSGTGGGHAGSVSHAGNGGGAGTGSGSGDGGVHAGHGGDGAGTGGRGGAGTDGGTIDGGPGACNCVDGDLPVCTAAACVAGQCELRDLDDGEPIASQTAGDCRAVVCDGMGDTRITADTDDVDDDDNPCTIDACDGTTVTHEPEDARTACTVDGGRLCDGDGACVECVDATDCDGSDVCQSGSCVPEACMNQTQDGGETDVDCGGMDCAPCGPDAMCMEDADCAGGDCSSFRCVPNCDDGVKNGAEAAVDCGQGCPSGCDEGTACTGDGDCASGFCDPLTGECTLPSCNDHVHNGDETDEDCGGPMCDDCGPDRMCMVDGDCTGGDCGASNTCVPNCNDGVQNDGEGGVDCGGTCLGCNGDVCTNNPDCRSGMCYGTCLTDLNGCTIAGATDRTSMADVTITQSGSSYSPACIRVSVGSVVHISNSSVTHPFVGGQIVNTTKTPSSSGPFAGTFTSGALAFTMSSAGSFPYYCNNHGVSSGMKGAVFVVP